MSWLKLKSAVMDAVCRRKLATPGEYSFVSKYLHLFYNYYKTYNVIILQGPP